MNALAASLKRNARPFLKWAGGKTSIVDELLKHVPATFTTYHESFLGGGALFFALQPKRAVLSDLNPVLIDTYIGVRDHVEEIIEHLTNHYARLYKEFGAKFYYAVRSEQSNLGPGGTAAWMIFLNKTGFNGLWRVNAAGKYNVPAGKFKNPPTICDAENLRACSSALQDVEIYCRDFRVLPLQVRDRLFYYDPPYVPVSATANFTSYTKEGFGPADQLALRDLALVLKERGAHVILSNAGSADVAKLYADLRFTRTTISVRRNINSKAKSRGPVGEIIIT